MDGVKNSEGQEKGEGGVYRIQTLNQGRIGEGSCHGWGKKFKESHEGGEFIEYKQWTKVMVNGRIEKGSWMG